MQNVLLKLGGWIMVMMGWGLPLAAAQTLKIAVSDPSFKPYLVAVPDLLVESKEGSSDSRSAELITKLLRFDIDLARFLALVPPNTYVAAPLPHAAVRYQDWRSTMARGLVIGEAMRLDETLRVGLKFYDVVAEKEILTHYCSLPTTTPSSCVHNFVDKILKYLTNEDGIFSSQLAFVRRVGKSKTIFTSDIDGSNVQQVVKNDSLNLLPAFSADGQFLYYTSFIRGNADLWQLHLNSKKSQVVSKRMGLNMGASLSPDGQLLALTLSGKGNTEIYTLHLGTGELKQLTSSWGQDVSPSFSPDGSQIAFVSSRSGNPHIYSMLSNGSGQHRLTFQGKYNQEPDWSPLSNGSIAFTARDELLEYDIFLVHPKTFKITRLTQDTGNNDSPSFSPDGQSLVFTSTREHPEDKSGRKKSVWVMDVDGSNQRKIPLPEGEYESPTWGPRRAH